jgi:hypothetical protein
MSPHRENLEALIARLGPDGWPKRFQYQFDRRGRSVTLTRGSMQRVVRAVDGQAFEVLYEHALHEVTRERCDFERAAALLDALLRREGLGKVELPPC